MKIILDKVRGYIVRIAKEVCNVEALSRHEERIGRLEENFIGIGKVLDGIDNRLINLEELSRRLDASVLSLKKIELIGLVDERLAVFEGNMDDKIVGFWKAVEDKFNTGNGNGRAYVGLMKRLAQLEGVRDAIEHRRSTQEIIEKRNMLRNDISSITNNTDLKVAEARLADLDWVLGEP